MSIARTPVIENVMPGFVSVGELREISMKNTPELLKREWISGRGWSSNGTPAR
jgi:hypothetical protein